MSTNTKSTHLPLVILGMPKNVPGLISYARNIVNRMTANPSFPVPTPKLAAVTTATDELQAAETATLSRTKGAAAVRNEKRTALVLLLRQLRGYVQTVADADPTNAVSLIESSGFAVRKTTTHQARVFGAKPGRISGSVALVAGIVAKRSSYEWAYSTDGGKTWVAAPVTLQARTTVAGLTPGATVLFKSRAVTKAGEEDWSQPVSLVIQ
jgi:hypothetical protein